MWNNHALLLGSFVILLTQSSLCDLQSEIPLFMHKVKNYLWRIKFTTEIGSGRQLQEWKLGQSPTLESDALFLHTTGRLKLLDIHRKNVSISSSTEKIMGVEHHRVEPKVLPWMKAKYFLCQFQPISPPAEAPRHPWKETDTHTEGKRETPKPRWEINVLGEII